MNNNSRSNKNRILSKDEIEKLVFTENDQKAVFSRIQISNESKKSKAKTKAVFILAPISIVALALVIMLQSPMKNHVLAAIPFLETFFSEHGDEGQKEATKSNEVQHVNQTADDSGVKVTFKEIFYDGARISAVYSIHAQSGKYKNQDLDFFLFNMKVNGKAVNEYGLEGGKTVEDENGEFIKVQNIVINQTLPENFTLDFSIQELVPKEESGGKTLKGNWNFSFPVKKSGESYHYTPSIVKNGDMGELRVKEIVFAPSGVELTFETKQKEEIISEAGMLDFKLFNEKGEEIKQINSGARSFRYKSGIGTGIKSNLYMPVKQIPKSITVKPVVFEKEPAIHTVSITEKLPFYLPQGENGGILIKKIEKKQDETWVYFDVKGDFVRERKDLVFMYKKGKENTHDNSVEREQIQTNNKRENQIMKFKTPYSEDLTIASFNHIPEWIEDWEMKIPIKKDSLKKMDSK